VKVKFYLIFLLYALFSVPWVRIYEIQYIQMLSENKYCIKISSYFTPDNIELYSSQADNDHVVLKLLENLALNYGIGNVNSIYKTNYLKINSVKNSIQTDKFKLYTFPLFSKENPRIAIAINKMMEEIIIVITYPKSNPDIYLKLLKSVNDFLSNEEHINLLIHTDKPEKIWAYFDNKCPLLPDKILVQDFMERIGVFLNESNNLKDAIDMFIHTGWMNIPVIDIEGNLIGEVTAKELMEVCLPRYILWMDDIEPIIHFEPFQNMLEQEENTWLAEILNYDVSVVQKDEPLMKAAIQMTKKEISHTYVLDDKKLIGIITLRYFLNQILRA